MRLRRCAIISPVAALLVNAVAPGGQALPHEFFPTYGKTDALTLAFYVKSSEPFDNRQTQRSSSTVVMFMIYAQRITANGSTSRYIYIL